MVMLSTNDGLVNALLDKASLKGKAPSFLSGAGSERPDARRGVWTPPSLSV
jgi:hypothetical protein